MVPLQVSNQPGKRYHGTVEVAPFRRYQMVGLLEFRIHPYPRKDLSIPLTSSSGLSTPGEALRGRMLCRVSVGSTHDERQAVNRNTGDDWLLSPMIWSSPILITGIFFSEQ